MKLVTWNVNGLRAALGKGLSEYFDHINADCFCMQEIKCGAHQVDWNPDGYQIHWNSAIRAGYSGTATLSKHPVLSESNAAGDVPFADEGRTQTLEFEKFYLVNCYTPNAKRDLSRLDERMVWEDAFYQYLQSLDAKKPVILCGDLNVAHRPIDLRHPKPNENSAGYTPQERAKMDQLLSKHFTDSFRLLYPDQTDAYTWWSYMNHARQNNAGWRIDYFIISNRLNAQVKEVTLENQILGSDHCPVILEIDL